MKRIFMDMDGVICEYRPEATVCDMQQPGYFASLRPRKEVIAAVRYLMKSGQAEVYVLSALLPQVRTACLNEKNAWLDRFLPEIDMHHRIFPLCGQNKADAVNGVCEEDVLCDDHTPNLLSWVQAGGRAVKILNGHNGRKGVFAQGPRLQITDKTDLLRATLCL